MRIQRIRLISILVLAFAGSGCQPETDLEAERLALLDTDRALSAMTATEGYAESYHHFSAEGVILLPPGQQPRTGRETIYREDLEAGVVGALSGAPEDGEVSPSGEMGWTWGRWTFTLEGEDGVPVTTHGKYLNVWKKIEGEWRMVANAWNDNPEV